MNYPGDARCGEVQRAFNARYIEAKQTPDNTLSCVWCSRWMFDLAAGNLSDADSFAKHDRELCVQLGLTPPFEPAPRMWKGNMCGVRVPGLPFVPGGASDASLVLSWFYDRYNDADRAKIRAAWQQRGYTHVVVSWPDSRAFGHSAAQFVAMCQELINAGFYPCPFLYSKDYDPADVPMILANAEPAIQLLVGLAPAVCIGWELSIALNPTQVQQLIDAIAPRFTPAGTRVYVHFQEGYMSFPQPDHDNASFWVLQVGKLTGVLHQRKLAWSHDETRYRYTDVLDRMAGNDGMPSDSGFGHPFDAVGLELTAALQFEQGMSEADGDVWGSWVIDTPPSSGPAGQVIVMGSGNGVTG